MVNAALSEETVPPSARLQEKKSQIVAEHIRFSHLSPSAAKRSLRVLINFRVYTYYTEMMHRM